MPRECAAVDCQEKSVKESPYSFHSFPQDYNLRLQWAVNMNRKDPQTGKLWMPREHDVLCSKHFAEDSFTMRYRMLKQNGIPCLSQLLPNVVPTIFTHNEDRRKKHQAASDRRSALAKKKQKREVSHTTKVCSRHFLPEDFHSAPYRPGARRLNPGAIPSLFLGNVCTFICRLQHFNECETTQENPDSILEKRIARPKIKKRKALHADKAGVAARKSSRASGVNDTDLMPSAKKRTSAMDCTDGREVSKKRTSAVDDTGVTKPEETRKGASAACDTMSAGKAKRKHKPRGCLEEETSSSGRKRYSKKILADTTEGDAVCHELLDVKKEAPDQEDRKLPEKLLFSERPFHDIRPVYQFKSLSALESDNMCDQQRECVYSQCPEQLLFAVKKEPVDPEDQIKSPGVNIASSVSLSDSSCMCSKQFRKSTQNSQELFAVKQEVLDQDQITTGEPQVPGESFHDSSCMCSKHFKKSTQNSQELLAVKQEVLDQDQITTGEPLVPSESFYDINPILESKAASISTFYSTQGELVSSEENFTIELNPEWLLENGNSENVSY